MTPPTFMILGAAKSGTTALYHYLNQHPDICMSYPKEPLFFWGHEYFKGGEFYKNKYYKNYRDEKHTGDSSHKNLYLPYVLNRIKDFPADPLFLVICRHPVERAISHYNYRKARGEEQRTFEEVIDINLKRLETGPFFCTESEAMLYMEAAKYDRDDIDYPSYIDTGYYAEQIERYISQFGRSRIKILLFEDLINNTDSILSDIFNFLGIKKIEIQDTKVKNQLAQPIVYNLYKIIGKLPGIDFFPSSWKENTKHMLASKLSKKKTKVKRETYLTLSKHFKEHNDRLEKIIGRDLSHWNVI